MDTAFAIVIYLAFIALVIMAWVRGYPSRFTLLEYQRGVLYRRGIPVKELGSGNYWIWVKIEKVYFLDTRPIQTASENQGVILRNGTEAGFSILANARVADVSKATYSSANYNNLPGFIFVCSVRSFLNETPLAQLHELGPESITEQIAKRARARLADAGFEMISFQLTQLSLPTPHSDS